MAQTSSWEQLPGMAGFRPTTPVPTISEARVVTLSDKVWQVGDRADLGRVSRFGDSMCCRPIAQGVQSRRDDGSRMNRIPVRKPKRRAPPASDARPRFERELTEIKLLVNAMKIERPGDRRWVRIGSGAIVLKSALWIHGAAGFRCTARRKTTGCSALAVRRSSGGDPRHDRLSVRHTNSSLRHPPRRPGAGFAPLVVDFKLQRGCHSETLEYTMFDVRPHDAHDGPDGGRHGGLRHEH